nr:hypothetical protein BaRGS_003326 [Batillaria attramentaria]
MWTEVPQDASKAAALRSEVAALLQKQATELVGSVSSPAFYSRLFVVPKPGGKWRPVIDLSALNAFLHAPHFRMETAAAVRAGTRVGDFAVSLDLSDAYLHVPMHTASRRYLRFAIDGSVYQFKALPFGLNLSPWIFTRLMDTVAATARLSLSSQLSNYLDDLLLKNQIAESLSQDRDVFLSLLRNLGFLVNLDKSDLLPSQKFLHLGMFFETDANRISLPQKRIDAILAVVEEILSQPSSPARLWLRFLGLLNAAADLLPLGRLRTRRLQLYLLSQWRPVSGDLQQPIPLPLDLLSEFNPWTDPLWLASGVPLTSPPPSLSLCTDASQEGWGAHLLPNFEVTHGLWSPEEKLAHINVLELRAVWLALQHWCPLVSKQPVLVLTDNSTVVAYIRKQGGTRSTQLCELTRDLLLWCESQDVTLSARHIPGRLNVIADSLSRHGQILHTEWTLNDATFNTICQTWDRPHVDLFATRWNHKLPLFVSPVPDPLAWAVDALSIPWNGLFAYAFPPTVLIPKVLTKLEGIDAIILLVAPLRWEKSWITSLLRLATDPPLRLPCHRRLLRQPRSQIFHLDPDSLNLHAWRLSGLPSDAETSRVQQWRQSLQRAGPLL